jgi:hypothetical protein
MICNARKSQEEIEYLKRLKPKDKVRSRPLCKRRRK